MKKPANKQLKITDKEKVRDREDNDDFNTRIKGIILTLFQLEKETRGCGLGFSALLIHAAALSFSCARPDLRDCGADYMGRPYSDD